MRCVVLAIGILSALNAAAAHPQVPPGAGKNLKREHEDIPRSLIIFHGKGRNVEGYFKALRSAAPDLRHVILLAPQFLREEDAKAHRLPKEVLRWHEGSWSAGWPAESPVAISTFAVIDALLSDLGNRANFPNLATVVLFGHSGGGQLLNRYAIVGTAPAALAAAGLRVRFGIA